MLSLNSDFKFIIICDDLTGCGDIAYWAKYLNTNLNQKIINFDFSKKNNINSTLKKVNILIINTESRFDDEITARNKIKAVLKNLDSEKLLNSSFFIFKKIDSTLRGNFAIEIDEINSILNCEYIPFIPAYPEYLRWIKNKSLYIDKILLEDTVFAKDPKNPIHKSFIPEIINSQLKSKEKTNKFLIEDIKNIEEFECRVKNFLKNDNRKNKFYAGSSKFFGEILKNFMLSKNFQIKSKTKKNKLKFKDFFIIAGSFNEKTNKQIQFFKAKHNLKILEQTTLFTLYTNNKNTYLLKTPDNLQKNYSIKNINNKISDILSIYDDNNIKNILILLAGGETSYNFTKLFNIKNLDIIDTIDTGIILCKDKKSKINLILKSGGFGKKNFFEKVFKKFIDI